MVVPPDGGTPLIRLNGEQTSLVVGAAETSDAYAVRRNSAPPGFAAVPLHVHRAAEEAFYVTAGELAVYADGRWSGVPAGSFVLIPRGTRHALGNASADPVHWLTFISPATHSDWVLAEHELIVAAGGNAPDPAALAEVHRRYGLDLIG
ncbi:MAG TPA: cupin domain-containing protein, partial [Pseudonocardia sp.]|nr:cupin domain-containing protein [Pseudonocardia sp.]